MTRVPTYFFFFSISLLSNPYSIYFSLALFLKYDDGLVNPDIPVADFSY